MIFGVEANLLFPVPIVIGSLNGIVLFSEADLNGINFFENLFHEISILYEHEGFHGQSWELKPLF